MFRSHEKTVTGFRRLIWTFVGWQLNISLPTAYPAGPDGGIAVKVISGKSHGVESPVRPIGGCWYFHVTMARSDLTMFQDIR